MSTSNNFDRSNISLIDAELAYLTEERKKRTRHGPGVKPAVVVIDMQRFFLDVTDPAAQAAIDANVVLLERARAKKIPVFLAMMVWDSDEDVNPASMARFGDKRHLLMRGDPKTEIAPTIGPKLGDIVIEKKHASGFAGSRLMSELERLGIDTIVLTGTSTSGCVRATAIDGAALNLRMIVVEETLYEQRPISGPIALSEMADRYADIVTIDEAMEYLDKLNTYR